MTNWTDRQFDSMSWHDNHVHAMRIIEGSHGSGKVVFDIDYIMEWLPGEQQQGYRFRICPIATGAQVIVDRQWLEPRERGNRHG